MMITVRQTVKKLVSPVHAHLRASRIRLALDLMRPDSSMSLLDVGGGHGYGREFDELRKHFGSVTLLNPDPRVHRLAQSSPIRMTVADGDGCNLPWLDQSFDWVFSNAVLEHVGSRSRQEQFAREIERVARIGYFVSTPNRSFPLDPHTYLPWYHVMPDWAQKWIVRFSLGEKNWWEVVRLVGRAELQELFPEARIFGVGPWGIELNLVAYQRFPGIPLSE